MKSLIREPASLLNTKTAAAAAILVVNVGSKNRKLSSLRQGSDAARAQNFAYFAPFFKHRYFLQIRAESPAGCAHRKAPVMTESRCFTTSIALCHCQNPFLQDNTNCLLRAVAHP